MADFTTVSDYVLEETPQFQTLVSTFENGVEQRRAKRANSIREFKLQYFTRSVTDFTTVRDFFLSKKGALTSFTWTNPNDSVDYTVRYKEDSLRFVLKSYGIYDFDFTLIQVL
jgi:uncharacterized protein (TIGR02217 family)